MNLFDHMKSDNKIVGNFKNFFTVGGTSGPSKAGPMMSHKNNDYVKF